MKKKVLPSLFNTKDGEQGEEVEDGEAKNSDGEVKKVFTQFVW